MKKMLRFKLILERERDIYRERKGSEKNGEGAGIYGALGSCFQNSKKCVCLFHACKKKKTKMTRFVFELF